MLRTLVAGAVARRNRAPKPKPARKRSDQEICVRSKPGRSQMSTMTINGRIGAPARRSRCAAHRRRARCARPHRHQARLRGRRLRRLHRAGRRRAGRELPDAGARRRRQDGDDGRRHRRGKTASGAEGLHGARRPAMRLLHAGLHRRGRLRSTTAGGRPRATAMPSREEIGAALSGHLCRCGAYDGIFRAVADACAGRFDGDDVVVAAHRGARQGDGRGEIHRRHPS